MALEVGYWMNVHTGKLISVSEHGGEVIGSPEVFGMTYDDLDKIMGDAMYNPFDTSKGSIRGKLIIATCQKGWARIRSNRSGEWSIQCFGTSKNAADQFVKKLGKEVGPYARVQLSDFATGDQETLPFDQFKRAAKAGFFENSGSAGPAVGRDAAAETGDKQMLANKNAIPTHLSDEQKRKVMRGHLGQDAGIPGRDVEESAKSKSFRQRLLESILNRKPTNPSDGAAGSDAPHS